MDHLSSSQISLYLQCSLKYKFQYVDQIPKTFKASGLVFGSAIHAALAWFHKTQLAGREVTLERLYRVFEADWYGQRVESEVRYKSGETETSLLLLGKEILGLYFKNPRQGVKGTEIPFTVPLSNPASGEDLGINLEGFIDLIEDGDTITEFKTSVKAMDIKDVGMQLTAYSYAYEFLHQRPPKLLKLVNFIKTKKPRMLSLEMREGDHQRFFHLAREVFRGIQAGIFFPRQSFLCSGCEYVKYCVAWGRE